VRASGLTPAEQPALFIRFPHQHLLDLQQQSWLLLEKRNDLVR